MNSPYARIVRGRRSRFHRITGPLLLCSLALLISGCAAKQLRPTTPRPAENEELPGTDREYPSETSRERTAGQAFPDPTSSSTGSGDSERTYDTYSGGTGMVVVPTAPAVVGQADVDAEPVELPEAIPRGAEVFYSVQLWSSTSKDVAGDRRDGVADYFEQPVRVDEEGGLYKVRVGMMRDRELAEEMRRSAVALGYEDAYVVEIAAGRPSGGAR